uniref:UDP-glucuronosyltransferase n=1 Tax=Timema tahoe TaxID=61484 RepID=A0A7R9P0A2_9NEOP|nr:unnamed protein product [Timema tahoe]
MGKRGACRRLLIHGARDGRPTHPSLAAALLTNNSMMFWREGVMLQTHRNFFYIFLLTLTISFCRVDGARILGVFPHLAKSHFIMDEVLMKGLAARERFGNPDNPAYIPVHFLAHSDKMNFYERLLNTVAIVPIKLGYKYLVGYKSEQVARKYFGDSLPPLEEIARNTSLHLVNTHFSLFHPRPFVPAVVEVGGIHLGEPKKLSKEFTEFLDGAKHGVIYLSLGSTVRSDSFPEEKRLGLLQAFAQLPQKVLWKWEADNMPDKPDNVKIAKWMPQLEILSHPKVKVFITHGGLMGTMEAAYFGVPMVAIPLFGDQKMNVKTFVDKGIAVKLDYNEISKEAVLSALRMVLEDPSYSENAKQVARAFRDRPLSAMDTATYWIEYIIRHKGVQHLRSAAADLPWYQILLLDVIAVLLAGIVIIIYVIYCSTDTFWDHRRTNPVPLNLQPGALTTIPQKWS